nr:hypothetical protein [uncultured Blautia sp.]
MKNNAWKKLKKENNGSELNLTVEDIGYVNKVCTYAESHGVGLIETQLLRKDLIGMGMEAKKEGVLLEERLGAVEDFAENIVLEGKREDHKEQIYTWIQWLGIGSMVLAGFHGLLVLMGDSGNTLLSRNCGTVQLLSILSGLIMLTVLHFLSGRYILDKKKDHLRLVMVVGLLLLFRISSRNFMLKEMANEIMFPNWILLIVIAVGFFLYICGTYLFDKLLEERAREYHLEKN